MKQVQLKIEEFFDNSITFDVSDNGVGFGEGNLRQKVIEIIESTLIGETQYDFIIYGEMEDGQSRGAIIQALWSLQKSLLPDSFHYLAVLDDIDKCNIFHSVYDDIDINFYDPETRIITITDFGGGE